MKIPLYKPLVTKPDIAAVLAVLRSGWLSHRGPAVGKFEKAFARAVGAPYAVAVSSGTAALHCALVAAGVKPGDDVLVPGLTYVATANAVRHAGATPVFCDVDEDSWTVNRIGAYKTARTQAIVPVHLYGHPAVVLSGNIVEDCCEALGAVRPAGVAAWSFFANKTITAGEGGMVTMASKAEAHVAWSLSHQGLRAADAEYDVERVGHNYRMTAMQAALGLSQLRRLGRVLARKRAIARWYREELAERSFAHLPVTFQADHPQHAHWLVSARVRDRDGLRRHLASVGIETRPVFPAMGDTEVAHRIAAEGLSLPSWPGLHRWHIRLIANEVRRFYR